MTPNETGSLCPMCGVFSPGVHAETCKYAGRPVDGHGIFFDYELGARASSPLMQNGPEGETCIGRDPACPCPDGDPCHYKDAGDTKAWPIPAAVERTAQEGTVPWPVVDSYSGGGSEGLHQRVRIRFGDGPETVEYVPARAPAPISDERIEAIWRELRDPELWGAPHMQRRVFARALLSEAAPQQGGESALVQAARKACEAEAKLRDATRPTREYYSEEYVDICKFDFFNAMSELRRALGEE